MCVVPSGMSYTAEENFPRIAGWSIEENNQMKHLVIVGCGDVGIALGHRMRNRLAGSGLRRDRINRRFRCIAADHHRAAPGGLAGKGGLSGVLPAAGRRDAELYRRLYVEGWSMC